MEDGMMEAGHSNLDKVGRMGTESVKSEEVDLKDDQCERKKPDDWTVNQDQNFGSASA